MTVSTTNRKNSFQTNGVTVDFPFTFAVTNKEQVFALTIDSEANETPYTNFTVVLNPTTAGGTLTTGDVLNDVELLVYRQTPLTQNTDYINGGRFPADSHEEALDKLTLQNQDQQEELDRTLKSTIGVSDPLEVGGTIDGQLIQRKGSLITAAGAGIGDVSSSGVLEISGTEIISSGLSSSELIQAADNANNAADRANEAADNANDAIAGAGGVDIGDYENNPTFTQYNQYVVYQRSTTPSQWQVNNNVPLPYNVDTATYPNPTLDPNLRQISTATQNLNEVSWHGRTINNDVIIPSNKNAFSVGPELIIGDNVTVTVGNNSTWRIL